MCAGAIGRYLHDRQAMPDTPLTAQTPITVGDTTRMTVVDLATDEPDPARRLTRIDESMRRGAGVLFGLNALEYELLRALTAAPPALARLTGIIDHTRPSFNLTIGRTHGPRRPMYFNGARLDGLYPLPTVTSGQALSLAVTECGENLDVGVVGCRRAVPDLGRIPVDLENSLTDLEQSVT
jgi:hypothetical protein